MQRKKLRLFDFWFRFPLCFESFRPWFDFTAYGAVWRSNHHHQPFFPYARAIKNEIQFDLFTRRAALIQFCHSPAYHRPNQPSLLHFHQTFKLHFARMSLTTFAIFDFPSSLSVCPVQICTTLRIRCSLLILSNHQFFEPFFYSPNWIWCLFVCHVFAYFSVRTLSYSCLYTREYTGPATLFASSLDAVGFLHYERYDYYGCGMWAVVARRSSNVSTSAWRVKTHAEFNWTAPHPIFSIESRYT